MDNLLEKLNSTTYRKIAQDNPKDFLEVEIGDAKQDLFYPQVKIKRWNGECNFSVRLLDNETGEATFKKDHEKVIWEKGDIKVDFYDIENAYKFDYIIKKKPATNKLTFSIQSKDVVFYYQPPLTQKEIDDGAERPDNVVGSYAVYAETPKTNWVGGKEYKTGKIGHIYRPKLIDADGTETWADLKIENGKYEVTIPEDFYNNAKYPIRSNDTFGYTSVGLSDNGTYVNRIMGSVFTSPASGISIDSATFSGYRETGDANFKIVIVLNSNLTLVADGVSPAQAFNATSQPWTVNYTSKPSLAASTDYILATTCDTSYIHMLYDTGSATQGIYDSSNSYSTPVDLGSVSTSDRKYSIYATYTPAGGAATDKFFQLF